MRFGERVLLLRRRIGLTQKQLGVLAELNTNTIARLERGDIQDPSGSVVLRLARALNTTTDYLLCGAEDPTPPRRGRRGRGKTTDKDADKEDAA
jgi:transcriptional regulator with XRE-family HTH domain